MTAPAAVTAARAETPVSSGDQDPGTETRVLVVAHYASDHISGEASIPLHVFRRLRSAGVEAWLLTHESFRGELAELSHREPGRLHFSRSLPGGDAWFRWGERLPDGPRSASWAVSQLERQLAMWPEIRRLVRRHGITVVHQPVGVAPSVPSVIAAVGAPVVMGPLNGGMSLPPGFRGREPLSGRLLRSLRTPVGAAAHWIVPGRRRARVVLVANERTRHLLGNGLRGEVRTLSEIGVVSRDWPYQPRRGEAGRLHAVFVGRLVGWKAVDLLLRALAELPEDVTVSLDVIGDGPERERLQSCARELGVEVRVRFTGWLSPEATATAVRDSDVLVLPSLREAGGAVLLEAMASGRPVIASAWGGPCELVPPEAGILVAPSSPEEFVSCLALSLGELARDPDRRLLMGAAGRRHVENHYDWDRLTRELVRVYRAASSRSGTRSTVSQRVGAVRAQGISRIRSGTGGTTS